MEVYPHRVQRAGENNCDLVREATSRIARILLCLFFTILYKGNRFTLLIVECLGKFNFRQTRRAVPYESVQFKISPLNVHL